MARMTRRDWVHSDLESAREARMSARRDTDIHPACEHAVALAYAETGRRLLAWGRGVRIAPPPRYPENLLGLDAAGTCVAGSPAYEQHRARARLKRLLRPAARRIFAVSRKITLHRSPSPEARGVTLALIALLVARELELAGGAR